MSFATITGAPIVVTIDGTQYELPKPKRKLLGPLYAKWVEEDRQALKRTLDDTGVSAEERRAALVKFAEESRLASFPLVSLYDFGRAEETLAVAGVEESVIDALDAGDVQRIAMRMWGFRVPDEEGDESPKGQGPSPTTGP